MAPPQPHKGARTECAASCVFVCLGQMGACCLEVDGIFLTFPATVKIPQVQGPGHFSSLIHLKPPKAVKGRNYVPSTTRLINKYHRTSATKGTPPHHQSHPQLVFQPHLGVLTCPWSTWPSLFWRTLPSLGLFPAPLPIPTSWCAVCLHLKGAESSGGQSLTEANASLPGVLGCAVVKRSPNLDRHTGRAPLGEYVTGP